MKQTKQSLTVLPKTRSSVWILTSSGSNNNQNLASCVYGVCTAFGLGLYIKLVAWKEFVKAFIPTTSLPYRRALFSVSTTASHALLANTQTHEGTYRHARTFSSTHKHAHTSADCSELNPALCVCCWHFLLLLLLHALTFGSCTIT